MIVNLLPIQQPGTIERSSEAVRPNRGLAVYKSSSSFVPSASYQLNSTDSDISLTWRSAAPFPVPELRRPPFEFPHLYCTILGYDRSLKVIRKLRL